MKQFYASTLLLAAFLASCGDTPPAPIKATDLESAGYTQKIGLPTFETTAYEVKAAAEAAIKKAEDRLAVIGALKEEEITFANTAQALEFAYAELNQTWYRLSFLSSTAVDADVREAAAEADAMFEQWGNKTTFRQDIYAAFKKLSDKKLKLDTADSKLLNDTLLGFKQSGLELAAFEQGKLMNVMDELSSLTQAFQKNRENATPNVDFTKDELAGLDANDLAALLVPGTTDQYRVKANIASQSSLVLRKATKEASRKKVWMGRMTTAKAENMALWPSIVAKRAVQADILGYDNWAQLRLEPKMAKKPKKVSKFLEKLKTGLEPKLQAEFNALRALKVRETGDAAATLEAWDMSYFQAIQAKEEFSVDTDGLKVYFPMERTMNGMFEIYQEIFGINFTEMQPPQKWVSDIRAFLVTDKASGKDLGIFYLDLYPRQGKYTHFAQFTITKGGLIDEKNYQRPVVALVCNFPKAVGDVPSLLNFGDVETLFHEFGHAMHSIMSQAKYATYSGTAVARDFVESPSQMLENWVSDKNVLARFAADYRDTSKKFPLEMLKKMQDANNATMGYQYRKQIAYGLMDMDMHSIDVGETIDVLAVSQKRLNEVEPNAVPAESAFIADFGHLAGGYDAGYYGYLWAEVISDDMASVFRKDGEKGGLGFLNPIIGMKLRNEVYAVGGEVDIEEALKNFLGRPFNDQAFLEKLGLKAN